MNATLLQLMPVPPDIIVELPRRGTVLVVECKFEDDVSPPAAARLRNRLLTGDYLDIPHGAFFMLALPQSFHLWKPGATAEALPDYTANSAPVLRSYLGKIAEEKPWPGADNMGLAVSAWLGDLAGSIRKPEASGSDQMLVDAGLYDAMRGGSVRREIAS